MLRCILFWKPDLQQIEYCITNKEYTVITTVYSPMELHITHYQEPLLNLMLIDDVCGVNRFLRSSEFTNDPFSVFTHSWTPIHELRSSRCLEAVIDRLHELGVLHKALEYVVYTEHLNCKRGDWGSSYYGMTVLL